MPGSPEILLGTVYGRFARNSVSPETISPELEDDLPEQKVVSPGLKVD